MIIIVTQKKRSLRCERTAIVILWMLSLFVLFYFLRSPSTAKNAVKSALDVCAVGLIPSLFPFVVLVSIINSSGLSQRISKIVGVPLGVIFGISESASSAIILGALGGFPIGAVCTRELYTSAEITKSDAERLITFTNNASPAFCIGVVGASFFGDTAFGVRLYLCQMISGVTVGILQRKKVCAQSVSKNGTEHIDLARTVTAAISNGALTMLTICAFAVFFAVVGDALCTTVRHYFGDMFATLVGATCEITLGARTSVTLGGNISRILCAFAVGWSGISVHMQVSSILADTKISMRRYYLCKLMQGILTASLICLFI